MEESKELNLIDKVKNFGSAMTTWATEDKFGRVSTDVFEKRKEICKTCPHWNPDGYAGIGQCNKCGCSVMKLYIPSSVCPDHPPRWQAITS